jgi:hypothetical protein
LDKKTSRVSGIQLMHSTEGGHQHEKNIDGHNGDTINRKNIALFGNYINRYFI